MDKFWRFVQESAAGGALVDRITVGMNVGDAAARTGASTNLAALTNVKIWEVDACIAINMRQSASNCNAMRLCDLSAVRFIPLFHHGVNHVPMVNRSIIESLQETLIMLI